MNEFIALNGPNVSVNSLSERTELSGWIAPSVSCERQLEVSVPFDNCECEPVLFRLSHSPPPSRVCSTAHSHFSVPERAFLVA